MVEAQDGDGGGGSSGGVPPEIIRQVRLAKWAQQMSDAMLAGSWDYARAILDILKAYLEDEVDLAEALEDRLHCKSAYEAIDRLTREGRKVEDLPEETQEMLRDAIEKGRDHS